MLRFHNCDYLVVLLGFVAGCSDSQPTETSGGASTAAQISESTDEPPTESTILKQEMVDAAVEIMKTQEPNTDPNEVRGQVENAIVQIRKHYPEFLIVSAEAEEKLRAGTPIHDSAKRIADAESFLSEFEIQLSGLVQSLLPQHKAGNLTPVRTELLAQLIVADMKKAERALTN